MRKIALVTTSRADYGIQSRLIRMLQDCPDVEFSLIVSGTHLSKKHGMTINEIERDGITIRAKIDIGIDTESDIAIITSNAITGFSHSLSKINPEICILLGDRYEMLAAAIACTLNNIPIAHIHGGEATQGAFDEAFRHSITKMSHLHFTSCEPYRRRVIQLGESPDRVFNVGALGVENIHKVKLLSREELSFQLGITFRKTNFLVTFHPETNNKGAAGSQIDELLTALDKFNDSTIIFTHPNADSEGDVVAEHILQFVNTHSNAYMFSSLGAQRYLSLVKVVDAVVGNSSSGIIEVPSLGTATVNVGNREAGRIRAKSVIDCRPDKVSIEEALNIALSNDFQTRLKNIENPYDKPNTANRILEILLQFSFKDLLSKSFYDINQTMEM